MNIIQYTPLAFPTLVSVTPKHHSIIIVNEEYQNIDFETKFDIIGITATTPQIIRAYEIADEFRKRGISVVIGGHHVSVLPEEGKEHADSVVIGEAEDTWPQLLKDFENDELKPFYYQTKPTDLCKIPPINKDFVKKSFISTGIQTSRGCPYACKYCSTSNLLHGNVYRKREIGQTIDEIRNTPQKIIVFYDTSFTIDTEYTKSLFRELKKLNKKFFCHGNVDVLSKDNELLKLSKDAGCIAWSVGFESLSQNALNEVGKKTNKIENYLSVVANIHRHGMCVHGFFMFGLDNEYHQIFDDTLDFIGKSKLDSAQFSILTPFPGTLIYKKFLGQGRILTKDWSKYNMKDNIVFKPKDWSKAELIKKYKKLNKIYYSYEEIGKRLLNAVKGKRMDFYSLFFVFILDNIVYRYMYLKDNF